MKYQLLQVVNIVDMNDEPIIETVFDYGHFETALLPVGSTVITHPLGLKEFQVVYDKRTDEVRRNKIIDLEIDLVNHSGQVRVWLEPITLIIGQHDVGEYDA